MELSSRKLRARATIAAGALFILFFTVLTGSAQTFRGTILGTVTDSSGGTVDGATVTARNVATGLERTGQTSVDGSYVIPELPLGIYKVTISKSGFQNFVATGVKVDVAAESRLDAVLKPGNLEVSVTVDASTLPQIETTSDTLGGTLTSSQMGELPVNGRDYTKLIFLNPGVAGSPDQITDSPGSFGVFSVNGARGRSNNFLLDGTDMNDGYHNIPALNQGGVFAVPSAILPVDSIAELHVISNYEAEYGRNSGGTILFVTKSGGNDFHGSAIEFFRNSAFDARNFFNPVGQPQAPFHNNQYGGSLGGPIKRDKAFFYANYEGQRETGGSVSLDTVPAGGTGPAGSLTPADATNPVIASLLGSAVAAKRGAPLWPAANLPNAACGLGPVTPPPPPPVPNDNAGCASVITPFFNYVNSVIGKADYSINTRNNLSGRYFYSTSKQAFPLALSPTGGQLPGGNTVTPTIVHLVSLSLVTTFSTNMVNEARFGWNRFFEAFLPADMNFLPSTTGLCMSTATPCPSSAASGNTGLPVIVVGSLSKLGATSSDPRHRTDSNWQFIDNFGWKIGRHDIKFGYEFRRTTIDTSIDSSARGSLKFADVLSFLSGTLTPGSSTNLVFGSNRIRNTFQNSHGIFVQDSFRFNSRLTFNAGLRWDYSGVIGEAHNLGSECVMSAGPACTLAQLGTGGLSSGLYKPDYTNFAPRFSVAYDLFGTGKTVIRAGVGSFYDALYHSVFLTNSVNNSFFAKGPFLNPFGPAAVTFDTSLAAGSAACPAGVLTAGCPVFAAPPTPAGDITTVDRNLRSPLMYNFNLNVEHQLASKIVLQVGYVGSLGRHLIRFRDIDQPGAQAIYNSDCPNGAPFNPALTVQASCAGTVGANVSSGGVPRVFTVVPAALNSSVFYINQIEASANSNYHSLQTSLRVNGWHGLTSAANFVWSHSIDNASDGVDFVPNGSQPNDSTRAKLEKGNSNFDIRRRFVWNWVYQFPDRKGSWSKLTDGWGLDGVVNIQDGQPFQLNVNFTADYSGSGEFFDRPDVVGPIVINSQNPARFLDLTSFAVPCNIVAGNCDPGTRHFGNMGRDSLRGPALKQLDFSVFKDTKLGERVTMQLRAEIFNIFNHPNFSNPFLPNGIAAADNNGTSAVGGVTCATVAAGRSCGFLPITTTADVGPGNPFLGGGPPRGIQIAVKFTF